MYLILYDTRLIKLISKYQDLRQINLIRSDCIVLI